MVTQLSAYPIYILLHQYFTIPSAYYNFIKYKKKKKSKGKANNKQEFQLTPQNLEHKSITTTHSKSARHAFLTFESSLFTPSSSTARGDFSFACMDSASWRLSCHPIVSSYKIQIQITIRWCRATQVNFQYCAWSVSVNTMSGSANVKHFYAYSATSLGFQDRFASLLLYLSFKLPVTTQNKATSYASDLLEPIHKTQLKQGSFPSLWKFISKAADSILFHIYFSFRKKKKLPVNGKPAKNHNFSINKSTHVCSTIYRC